MKGSERPLADVPAWLWAGLVACLAVQIAIQSLRLAPASTAADLPPAPRAAALRAASVGEPAAAARLAMLYLQAFDLGAGNARPYQQLDFTVLTGWLRAILDTDPRSGYPLFAAARIYAEVEDPARSRAMLEFVHEAFLEDPNRRWPWLAHAALLAKHRLHDLPLARRYAADLDRRTTAADVPLWARQMEIFILEDMNELDAAKILLGGLLHSGKLVDPAERRYLEQRLRQLEERVPSGSRH
ncbi:MAG TPA: hypothetical protein VFP62_11845 [Burkholderiales bacterium]|nr:hypothetical protein [Burkholderiales bacterium]